VSGGRRSVKYPWDEVRKVINNVIEECYWKYGVEPSIRRVLYRLRDRGLLPVTEQAYRKLSEKLTRWREEGYVDWRKLRDPEKRRMVLRLEPEERVRTTPMTLEELKEDLRKELDFLLYYYYTPSINPWRDQPYRVVVYVEKESEFSVIERLIREVWEFGVYAMHTGGGYDSCTWKFMMAEDVKKIAEEGATPVILSFGDLDPSGTDIDRDFVDKIKRYSGVENLIWERVAVTKDQVEKYGLKGMFRSEDEYRKYIRDPRRGKYEKKYGMIKVELSEFLEEIPKEEVEKVIKSAIEKYFDWGIYNTKTSERLRKTKEEAERAKEETMKEVMKLMEILLGSVSGSS